MWEKWEERRRRRINFDKGKRRKEVTHKKTREESIRGLRREGKGGKKEKDPCLAAAVGEERREHTLNKKGGSLRFFAPFSTEFPTNPQRRENAVTTTTE